MALTDDNTGGIGATMLVGPTGGYGYPAMMPMYGGGMGGFGNGGDWWGILLLIALLNGGFGGWGGFGGGANMALGYDFPWLLNGQQSINNNVSDGFRDAQLNDNVTSVRDGINALSTQLCGCCGDLQMALANGFAGTTAAITGAQNAVAQQLYSNEIASLNRSFAEQTANAQGFTNVNTGVADLKYTVASEACADRAALQAGIQTILDKLCDQELQAERRENANLRQELIFARGQASQVDQTARILAGQAAEIDGVYNRLKNCPVPSMPVYGNTPIFNCSGNSGCGCGASFVA